MSVIKSSSKKNQNPTQILQNDFTPRRKENFGDLLPSKAWIRNMGAGTTNRNTPHRNKILATTDTKATQEIRPNSLDGVGPYKCDTQTKTIDKRPEEDIASSNQSDQLNESNDSDESDLRLTINQMTMQVKPPARELKMNKTNFLDESGEFFTADRLLNSTEISTTCVQMDKLSNELRNMCVAKSKCFFKHCLSENQLLN